MNVNQPKKHHLILCVSEKYLFPSSYSQVQSKFCKVKFVIFIMFESCDKTCSKIEKTWFLLVHWVANSSENEKNPEAVVQRCFCQKGFLKILQNSQENTCTGVFFIRVTDLSLFCKIKVNCSFIKPCLLLNSIE